MHLTKTLRCSANINIAAANLEDATTYTSGYKTTSALKISESSSVPGALPHTILEGSGNVNDIKNKRVFNFIRNMGKNIKCGITHTFKIDLKKDETQVVVLLGPYIDSIDIMTALMSEFERDYVTLYDCGVGTFDHDGKPDLYDLSDEEKVNQVCELEKWLLGDKSGLLVTHNALFCGMEAPNVVLISDEVYGVHEERSGWMRAVGRLLNVQRANSHHEGVMQGAAPIAKTRGTREITKEKVMKMAEFSTIQISSTLKKQLIQEKKWEDLKNCVTYCYKCE